MPWSNNDLTVLTGAPAPSGLPFGFAWENAPKGSSIHVVYVSSSPRASLHVQELSKIGKGNWAKADLTAITGAPQARDGDTPFGFVYPGDPSIHVLYRDANRHIHELVNLGGGDWRHYDLTAMTGAPDTQSAPFGFAYLSDPSMHVVYQGFDLHIHELVKLGGDWRHYDLTAMTGAPLGLIGSPPFGFAYPSDPSMHVVYQGFDKHIHELVKLGTGNWGHYDLTAMTRAPLAASAPFGFAFPSDPSMHVVYRGGDDRHVHELAKVGTGNWGHYDLTAMTGAPLAASATTLPVLQDSAPFGYGFSWEHDPASSSMHVVYLATTSLGTKSICQLYKVSGRNWGFESIPTFSLPGSVPPSGFAWEKDPRGSSLHVVYVSDPQNPSNPSPHISEAVLST